MSMSSQGLGSIHVYSNFMPKDAAWNQSLKDRPSINNCSEHSPIAGDETTASRHPFRTCRSAPTKVAANAFRVGSAVSVAPPPHIHQGSNKKRDFLRFLPVHISKYILSLLDKTSLLSCRMVNAHWKLLSEEVDKESFVRSQILEDVMLMQGVSNNASRPDYAADIDVLVPCVSNETGKAVWLPPGTTNSFRKSDHLATSYYGVAARRVVMEERNICCGSYNVLVLFNKLDQSRAIDTNGTELLAISSTEDHRVRICSATRGNLVCPVLSGHAGSVKCIFLDVSRDRIYTGSYDTTIRCWSISSGKIYRILKGHQSSVLSLTACDNLVASGSRDTTCKIWNLEEKKCLFTLRHRKPVNAVAMILERCEERVVSVCEQGRIKVWNPLNGNLLKAIHAHRTSVTGVCFDRWHILTVSKDCYAALWSTQGDYVGCLSKLRHPEPVLCAQFRYLRAITGCRDGKIRIWNVITSQCLRILRGNSHNDPILDLKLVGNRITINTQNSVLVLDFEPILYNYSQKQDKQKSLHNAINRPQTAHTLGYRANSTTSPKLSYSETRAQRAARTGSPDPRVLDAAPAFETDHSAPAQSLYHSSRNLSPSSLQRAKRIQSAYIDNTKWPNRGYSRHFHQLKAATKDKPTSNATYSCKSTKQEENVSPSAAIVLSESISTCIKNNGLNITNNRDSVFSSASSNIPLHVDRQSPQAVRKSSWAHEIQAKCTPPEGQDTTALSDAKAAWRMQIRSENQQFNENYTQHGERNECTGKTSSKMPRPKSSPARVNPQKIKKHELNPSMNTLHKTCEETLSEPLAATQTAAFTPVSEQWISSYSRTLVGNQAAVKIKFKVYDPTANGMYISGYRNACASAKLHVENTGATSTCSKLKSDLSRPYSDTMICKTINARHNKELQTAQSNEELISLAKTQLQGNTRRRPKFTTAATQPVVHVPNLMVKQNVSKSSKNQPSQIFSSLDYTKLQHNPIKSKDSLKLKIST